MMKFVGSCAVNGRLVMGYAVNVSLFPVWHYCCFSSVDVRWIFRCVGVVIGEWLYF